MWCVSAASPAFADDNVKGRSCRTALQQQHVSNNHMPPPSHILTCETHPRTPPPKCWRLQFLQLRHSVQPPTPTPNTGVDMRASIINVDQNTKRCH